MNTDKISPSVVTITSAEPDHDKAKFGTGFIIYRNGKTAYLLTCQHVVDDVGGQDKVMVGTKDAVVIAYGKDHGLDLAILKVEGLDNRPPLRLHISGKREDRVIIIGSQLLSKNPVWYEKPPIRGMLGEQTEFQAKNQDDWFKAWFRNCL